MAVSTSLLCKLRASPLTAVRDASRLLFSKYLFVTNTTVACTLAGTGDIITQHYEKLRHVRNSLCPVRTRNQCIQVCTGCTNKVDLLRFQLPVRMFLALSSIVCNKPTCLWYLLLLCKLSDLDRRVLFIVLPWACP